MAEERRTYQRRGQQVASPLEYAHVQPHASEVEMAVLGALMIDKDAFMEVGDSLAPESFYEPRNQMVKQGPVPSSCFLCTLEKRSYICRQYEANS